MKKNIEVWKSTAVVLLFISAFFLMIIKFYYLPYLKESKTPHLSISLKEALEITIEPNYLVYYLGENKTTKVYDTKIEHYKYFREDIQKRLSPSVKSIFYPNMTLTPSTNERAIEVVFHPTVNAKLLSMSIFGNKEQLSGLSEISRIYLSSLQNKPLYFEGKEGLIEFPIRDSENQNLLEQIKNSAYISYYSLNYLFDSKSRALVNQDPVYHFPVYATRSSLNSEKRELLAKKIFGQQFDFLSEIVETDGKYIYSYNYGQKIFKTDRDGKLEYLNENVRVIKQDLSEQFHRAVDFLKKMDYEVHSLRLHSYQRLKINENDATKFIFKKTFNGLEIDSNLDFYNVEVILIGSDVYKFTGYLRTFSGLELKSRSDVIAGLSALESLYTYTKGSFSYADSSSFFNSVSDFSLAYFIDQNLELIPCYRVSIRNSHYYIDIYNGEVIDIELE